MKPTVKRAIMTRMSDKERKEMEDREIRDYRAGGNRMGGYPYMGSDPDMMMPDPGYYKDPRYDGGYGPEMRSGRDSRGRYTSTRMGGYSEPWMGDDSRERSRESYKPMQKIGVSLDGEMQHYPNEIRQNYRADATYPMVSELLHKSGEYTMGKGETRGVGPMTKEMAKEWTAAMQNEDGTHGPHWTMEQTKQVMAQKGIECDPTEFFVAMNMIYSDYCEVAKKLGVNTVDFCAKMAKAFLDDKDSQPDKLSLYYEYIVK